MKHNEVLDFICKTEILPERMHGRYQNLMTTDKETGEVVWNRTLLEKFTSIELHKIMRELEDMVYG